MESTTPNFLLQVLTTSDRDNLIAKIKLVAQLAYQKDSRSLEDSMKRELPEAIFQDFQNLVSATNGGFDNQRIAAHCEELISILENLPVVALTLAYAPSLKQIEKITELARGKFSPSAILEINFDPGIVGGATISYAGKYYDFSLSKIIDQKVSEYNLVL